MSAIHAGAFHLLRAVGAPIGGVRPRRIYHWLAHKAWGGRAIRPEELSWYRDRWGHRFRLHPHYLIDRNIIVFGCYERELLDFLHERVRPGDVCMDVGANLGQVTVHFAGLVGDTGRVFAFEPAPQVAARLRDNVAGNDFDDRVLVESIALSNATGTAELHVADEAADNQGMGTLAHEANPVLSRTVTVPTRRLDDYVVERGIDRLDWIKIDIQGAEPLLLEGAGETLKRLAPRLLMEVSPADLRAAGLSSRDLLSLLAGHGYRLFDLELGRNFAEIRPQEVADDFYSSNVFCEPLSRVAESGN